jgi:Nuclease-related domain
MTILRGDASKLGTNGELRSLADHVAGEAVIRELLKLQSGEPPQTRTGRILGRSPLAPAAVPWYIGALGERAVGAMLDRLGPDWIVLHSIPVGDGESDIDHLAIGPGGVFTIDTKKHAQKQVVVAGDTFMVAGQRQPYIRASGLEARRVTIALGSALPPGVEVIPVIAVLDSAGLTVRDQPESVAVVDARALVTWLCGRTPKLDPSQVQEIAVLAAHPESWHSAAESTHGSAEGPSSPLLASFQALVADVARAHRRRFAWSCAASGAIAASCLLAAPLALRLFGFTG